MVEKLLGDIIIINNLYFCNEYIYNVLIYFMIYILVSINLYLIYIINY